MPKDRSQQNADRIERDTLRARSRAALDKRDAGRALNERDLSAIRKWQRTSKEETFRKFAGALPQSLVTELLDTSRKVIRQWEDAGMSRNTDRGKTYDLFAVIPWLKRRWMAGDDDAKASAQDRRRLSTARAELLEIELAEKQGTLVKSEDVEAQGLALVAETKKALFAIPSKVAGRLAQRDSAAIEAELTLEIENALRALSRRFDSGGD